MISNGIKIKIIAKDHIAFEGEAQFAIVPTKMGVIQILPNHAQLVSAIATGDLIIQIDNNEKKFKISGGVLEVRPHSEIIILADRIEE